ncbi:MAG: TonB-dependent receptor [Flavobacteriaceae bacterium]
MKILIFIFILTPFLLGAQKVEIIDSITIISLNEVNVEGIRASSDLPITYSNLSKEDLKSRNLGQDIPVLLNFLPSVVTSSDAGNGIGYTNLRVRGIDATRINVTINGFPYNDSESHSVYWVDLPDFASNVESFQLQRGIGTSTNGSGAFGGSINLRSDFLSEIPQSEISSSYGSFNTLKKSLRFSTGLINKNIEFSGRFSEIDSDGYVERAKSDLDSYFLQFAFKNKKTLFRILGFGGHEITYQSWYGIDSFQLKKNRNYNPAGEIYDENGNKTGFYNNQVDNYKQNHIQILWDQEINSLVNFSFGYNFTHGYGFYEEYNDKWYVENISFGNETNFKYLNLKPLEVGNTIISNTENITQKWLDNYFNVLTLRVNYLKNYTNLNFGGMYSVYDGDHYGSLVWGQNIPYDLINNKFYENKGIKKELSFFIKINQTISSKTSIYLDAQIRTLDYSIDGTIKGPELFKVNDSFVFFNPKVGITHNINDLNNLYFSYGKSKREPNRSDYKNGNPVSETLYDFEFGWRYLNNMINIKSNFYWMKYFNQLALTGAIDDVGLPIRENVGNSRRVGLEIDTLIKFNNSLSWIFNLSVSSNKNLDFFYERDGILESLGKTNLSFSPNLISASQINYKISKNLNFILLSKYVSKQYMGNIDSKLSILPSYLISDLNFSYEIEPPKFLKKISFSFLINNFLNKEYISNGYFYTYNDSWSDPNFIKTIEGVGFYPQAKRNFLIGVSILF